MVRPKKPQTTSFRYTMHVMMRFMPAASNGQSDTPVTGSNDRQRRRGATEESTSRIVYRHGLGAHGAPIRCPILAWMCGVSS